MMAAVGDRALILEGLATLTDEIALVNLITRMSQVAAITASRSEDAVVST